MHIVPPCGQIGHREPVPAKPLAQEIVRPSGLAENCSLEPFIGSLTFLRNTEQNGSLPRGVSIGLGLENVVPTNTTLGLKLGMMSPSPVAKKGREFDPEALLATIGEGGKHALCEEADHLRARGPPMRSFIFRPAR